MSLVLDYGMMPYAGGFAKIGDPRLKIKEPLSLVLCHKCTLMQTGQSIDPDSIFRSYSYSSSSSPVLVRHFNNLARHLFSFWGLLNKLVIDIGCNDGVLLRPLKAMGCTVFGIDPSDVALRASEEHDFGLINSYLDPVVASNFVSKHGKAELINASNVLAHTDNIHNILEGVRILIDEQHGLFTAEVHYQTDLIDKVQFDTVYHEHTCYYSLDALNRLFNDHDLSIWHYERTNIHAGSMRVYACHKNRRQQIHPFIKDTIIIEHQSNGVSQFKKNALRSKQVIHDSLSRLSEYGIYAYGAAGRSTILLNWCEIDDSIVSLVIDDSPLRIGKCIPGVEISIVDSSHLVTEHPKYCLITAWNYEKSIIRDHDKFNGTWIVPLPDMRFI